MQGLEQLIQTNVNAVRLADAGMPIKAATSNALTEACLDTDRVVAEVCRTTIQVKSIQHIPNCGRPWCAECYGQSPSIVSDGVYAP